MEGNCRAPTMIPALGALLVLQSMHTEARGTPSIGYKCPATPAAGVKLNAEPFGVHPLDPEAADGDGYFLVLKDLSLDNNVGENWMANASLSMDDSSTIFLKLYPNPVEDVLVVATTKGTVINKVTLWDFNGKRVANFEGGSHDLQLNIASVSSGMYYLTIETSAQTFVRKIIKK